MPLLWLSYPYGLTSPTAAQAVERAGYVGAFLVEGGWLPRQQRFYHPFALPRLNVPAGLSVEGFQLRLSGLLKR